MVYLTIGLTLLLLAGQSRGGPQHDSAATKIDAFGMLCSFAAKNQIYELSVLFEEKHLAGSVEVFDTRHKVVVENFTAPANKENGIWILKSVKKSDSIAVSREHRINSTSLAYERHSLVQMGTTPPLIVLDQGQCSAKESLHR
jgi:hypothetical protein